MRRPRPTSRPSLTNGGGDAPRFWADNQPGFRFTSEEPGTEAFFAAVERHRYALEPHIQELVDFARFRECDVLEVGCGIATDGIQFAQAGARYTGVDTSESALELARTRFSLESVPGTLQPASATGLPFPDQSFDLVYSHGVIHHIDDPDAAISEFHRVLRPGGHAIVMVYHRNSLNYYLNIMLVRRLLCAALLLPGATALAAKATGEAREVLEGHRRLLRAHGFRYLADRQLFLSNNTDGPGNPLSKVFTRRELSSCFRSFDRTTFAVRYLNLRLLPGGTRLEGSRAGRWLAARFGWHLYVLAQKATEAS